MCEKKVVFLMCEGLKDVYSYPFDKRRVNRDDLFSCFFYFFSFQHNESFHGHRENSDVSRA